MKKFVAIISLVSILISCVPALSATATTQPTAPSQSSSQVASEAPTQSTQENVETFEKPQIAETAAFSLPENFVAVESSLEINYDDLCSLSDFYNGYSIAKIYNQNVTSFKVSKGAVTSSYDDAVIKSQGDTSLYACGVGSAEVLLVESSKLTTAKNILNGAQSSETINAITLKVSVTPAPLTIVYFSGQSNSEGSVAANLGYHPEDSVVCEKGEIYSTYGPSNETRGLRITGLSNLGACTKDNANDYVAGSLGNSNTKSISSKELAYKPYALSTSGGGKTGPDSGFAYMWNQLSGDKVWTVNAAWGGTSVNKWIESGEAYIRAIAVFKAAQKTYEAELSSGHYTEGSRLCIWVQGEADKANSITNYRRDLLIAKDLLTRNLSLDKFGIIITRSSKDSNHKNQKDLYLTTPRIVQPALGNDPTYPDIYLVSRAHELWVDDPSVKEYFSSVYPSGVLSYPLRSNATISAIPKTVYDVHNDIHFSQAGHNENGLDAAKNMYDACIGADREISVKWLKENGYYATDYVNANVGIPFIMQPRISPPQEGKKYSVVTDTSYLTYDKNTAKFTPKKSGTTYIRLVDSDSNIISSLSVNIKTFKLDTPYVESFENTRTGAKITWNKIEGAYKYRIFYHDGTQYRTLATVSETSYTHTAAVSSTTYTYTVRCVGSDGSFESDYIKEGFKNLYLKPPVITAVENDAKGVKVSWEHLNGAQLYRVYRKDSVNTSWTRLGDTASTSFVDKTAKSNTSYTYTVRCLSADASSFTSSFDQTGKTIKYIAVPNISLLYQNVYGITITWNSVAGASNYRVYKKTSSGWEAVADTNSTTYYDGTATKKQSYTYSVRCISSDGKTFLSGFDSTGFTINLSLATPKITSFENTRDGVKITWSKVSGAYKYRVFYHDGTQYRTLATVSDTTYTHTSAVSSTTYTYTVRCVGADGSFESSYVKEGFSHLYLAPPVISNPTNTINGVKITWAKMPGAELFRIYRKATGETSWTKIGESTINSFTDTNVTSNSKYTYTVRCLSADKKKFTSSFNQTGKTITFISAPKIKSAKSTNNGVSISWNKVPGAKKYRVFVKTNSGWKSIGETTSTTFLHRNVIKNRMYTYTVRCVSSDSKQFVSGYYPNGYTIIHKLTLKKDIRKP